MEEGEEVVLAVEHLLPCPRTHGDPNADVQLELAAVRPEVAVAEGQRNRVQKVWMHGWRLRDQAEHPLRVAC